MKKLNNLTEANFLKLFFAFVSLCFLVMSVILPDRDTMFSGLWRIWTQICKVSTNYLALG